MTTPQLDPSLFAYAGSHSYKSFDLFEKIGLHKCRSEEGMAEMCRVLNVPDMPPVKNDLPINAVFIPATCLYFKPDYNTCRIGLIVPKYKKRADGSEIVYPDVMNGCGIYLGEYSILASTSGLYSVMYACGYSRNTKNEDHVKKAICSPMSEIRLDVPPWAYKELIIDVVERGKALVQQRASAQSGG